MPRVVAACCSEWAARLGFDLRDHISIFGQRSLWPLCCVQVACLCCSRCLGATVMKRKLAPEANGVIAAFAAYMDKQPAV
jgi:hypothetical protein